MPYSHQELQEKAFSFWAPIGDIIKGSQGSAKPTGQRLHIKHKEELGTKDNCKAFSSLFLERSRKGIK